MGLGWTADAWPWAGVASCPSLTKEASGFKPPPCSPPDCLSTADDTLLMTRQPVTVFQWLKRMVPHAYTGSNGKVSPSRWQSGEVVGGHSGCWVQVRLDRLRGGARMESSGRRLREAYTYDRTPPRAESCGGPIRHRRRVDGTGTGA